MLKRFLNIFKRDKRGFSNEELKWQKKVGSRVRNTMLAILILGEIIALFPMLNMFFQKFSSKDTIITALFVVSYVGLVVIAIVIDGIFYVGIEKGFIEEIRFQLKEQQRGEIMLHLEKQEYSKVNFQPSLLNEFFRLLLKAEKFDIEVADRVIRISLPDSNVEPLEITNENILEYFN